MSDKKVTLTETELEDVMANAIKRAFTEMGIDTKNPEEQQRDMAHLRRWRLAVDSGTAMSFKVIVATLVAGVLAALWLGFQAMLASVPHK